MSKTLPAEQYGDPAEIVRFESETCLGCKHQRGTLVSSLVWCGQGRQWGRRCEMYLRNIVIKEEKRHG